MDNDNSFDYATCEQLMRKAIVAALRHGEDQIVAIPILPIGYRDVFAVELSFLPDEYTLEFYFRTHEEGYDREIRDSCADWKHQFVVHATDCAPVNAAVQWLHQSLKVAEDSGMSYLAFAHLAYLATAEAMLSSDVSDEFARQLIEVGVNDDRLTRILTSLTGHLSGLNYCDYVQASRFTESVLLGTLPASQGLPPIDVASIFEEFRQHMIANHPQISLDGGTPEYGEALVKFIEGKRKN